MNTEKVYEALVEKYGETLTAVEIASVLKIHEQTCYNWLREGKFPFLRLNCSSLLRYNTADIASYITGNLTKQDKPEQIFPAVKKRGRGRPKKTATATAVATIA